MVQHKKHTHTIHLKIEGKSISQIPPHASISTMSSNWMNVKQHEISSYESNKQNIIIIFIQYFIRYNTVHMDIVWCNQCEGMAWRVKWMTTYWLNMNCEFNTKKPIRSNENWGLWRFIFRVHCFFVAHNGAQTNTSHDVHYHVMHVCWVFVACLNIIFILK